MNTIQKLTRNMVRCKKCNDIIESKSTHDVVRCTCGAVTIDGGLDYERVLFEGKPDSYETMYLYMMYENKKS